MYTLDLIITLSEAVLWRIVVFLGRSYLLLQKLMVPHVRHLIKAAFAFLETMAEHHKP